MIIEAYELGDRYRQESQLEMEGRRVAEDILPEQSEGHGQRHMPQGADREGGNVSTEQFSAARENPSSSACSR